MTGGCEENLTICSHCKREMVILFYGMAPAWSILCPDCFAKAEKEGHFKGLRTWLTSEADRST